MTTAELPASRLHQQAIVVDAHNDLLSLVARRPVPDQARYFRSRWLPQLREGGVDVQVLPAFSPANDLREIVAMLDAGHRLADENSDAVALCSTGREIERAVEDRKIALVLALEGSGALGTDVAKFETLFHLGVRMASFTHNQSTPFGDGSAEHPRGRPLSSLGVEALIAVEELGIVVDVSHLSAATLDDVVERARRPVVASHSSASALCHHHRNLTDDQIRAIAASGGVVGINFLGTLVDARSPSLERVVDHIVHVAMVSGPGHVGLGPDFIEEYAAEVEPRLLGQVTPGLGDLAGLPLVTEALCARHLPESDVRGILGMNWLSLLQREVGTPLRERSR